MEAQVIIVGGGLAGLSAAHTVLEQGGAVVLLDKMKFLGGNSTRATSGINGAQRIEARSLGASAACAWRALLRGRVLRGDTCAVASKRGGGCARRSGSASHVGAPACASQQLAFSASRTREPLTGAAACVARRRADADASGAWHQGLSADF
jgi:glycine/D-amino acid oxidase-like deaminating enzyme